MSTVGQTPVSKVSEWVDGPWSVRLASSAFAFSQKDTTCGKWLAGCSSRASHSYTAIFFFSPRLKKGMEFTAAQPYK